MKLNELLSFWEDENPCFLRFEEAICFAAYILKKEHRLSFTSIRERLLEVSTYYSISNRIMDECMKFLVANKLCSELNAGNSNRKSGKVGRPRRILTMAQTSQSIDVINTLAEIWETRIAPTESARNKLALMRPSRQRSA